VERSARSQYPRYRCALLQRLRDQRWVDRLGIAGEDLPAQHDQAGWPKLARRFAEVFQTKTRAEWEKAFAGSDACFAPVLSLSEVATYPHNAERGAFVTREGVMQPAPAPRFSRTEPQMGVPPRELGVDTDVVLAEFGFGREEIADLKKRGVVGAEC
jgi:alpha-methylacyl-CoA racemase